MPSCQSGTPPPMTFQFNILNLHQTMLHTFLNFSYIERYQACQIFYKQIPDGQYRYCQICVKCVIWKQIYKKCESVITDSWHTFSKGSG